MGGIVIGFSGVIRTAFRSLTVEPQKIIGIAPKPMPKELCQPSSYLTAGRTPRRRSA